MNAPKKPDHTGVFITPACFFVAAAILSALMISKAVQFAGGDDTPGRYYGTLKRGLGEMIESLARSLGVGGSVGLSAVLLLASGVWLFLAFRRYRALTAATR